MSDFRAVECTLHIPEISIKAAEQALVDNGIERCEAPVVLQAICYILLGADLYPQN